MPRRQYIIVSHHQWVPRICTVASSFTASWCICWAQTQRRRPLAARQCASPALSHHSALAIPPAARCPTHTACPRSCTPAHMPHTVQEGQARPVATSNVSWTSCHKPLIMIVTAAARTWMSPLACCWASRTYDWSACMRQALTLAIASSHSHTAPAQQAPDLANPSCVHLNPLLCFSCELSNGMQPCGACRSSIWAWASHQRSP